MIDESDRDKIYVLMMKSLVAYVSYNPLLSVYLSIFLIVS